MPNGFAYLTLLIWPVVIIILFKRLPKPSAVIWSLLAGLLLLPNDTSMDLPLLPSINKTIMPTLATFMMCLAMRPPRRGAVSDPAALHPGWMPGTAIGKILAVLFVFGPFLTIVLNGDPIFLHGKVLLPGLSVYDALSSTMGHAIALLPILMGRRYLADTEGHDLLLKALFFGGLFYTLPMLLEVRFSPQLHKWIYGFYQHAFLQTMRDGGFRPMVFLDQGLVVAMFISLSTLSGMALWRAADRNGRPRLVLGVLWLAMVLVLCKTVGAIGIVFLLAPLLLLFSARMQMVAASAMALMILLYPALRSTNLAPTDLVLSIARSIDESRGGSFSMRLRNEDMLLNRADERPVFGWGIWGRARVYDEETGADISVTDGYWVIILGGFGWIGYIATFGLLTLPIMRLTLHGAGKLPLATTGLSVVLTANLLDLIPNSGQTPITWLIAGALLGKADLAAAARNGPGAWRRQRAQGEGRRASAPEQMPDPVPPSPSRAKPAGRPASQGPAGPNKDRGPVRPPKPKFGGARD